METIENRIYSGIIVGIAVRRTIANTRTFRVRHGNGFYGSDPKKTYQDQFAYTVPSSINNPEGQPARDALKAGVVAWKGLSTVDKKALDQRASRGGLKMAGYHLFLREYIKAHT